MTKRILAVLLLCMLLISSASLAETGAAGDIGVVVKVKEYVTLREMPKRKSMEVDRIPLGGTFIYLGGTEGDFSEVSYRGQFGYVLSEYLKKQNRERGTALTPDTAMTIRLNLFLTTFSDVCFAGNTGFTISDYRDREMVDFAVDKLFSTQMEYGEWGDNNVRVDDTRIQEIVQRWFGVSSVNKKDTRYDYIDGYYYSCDTGGRLNGGFAIIDKAEMLDTDRCRVAFTLYGVTENWQPEAVCILSAKGAAAAFPGDYYQSGEAVIDFHGEPEDEQKWTLLYWFVKSN